MAGIPSFVVTHRPRQDLRGDMLRAGLLDELWIHLVPLLLGAGAPLFEGEQAELIPERKPVTTTVTHLRFRVATA